MTRTTSMPLTRFICCGRNPGLRVTRTTAQATMAQTLLVPISSVEFYTDSDGWTLRPKIRQRLRRAASQCITRSCKTQTVRQNVKQSWLVEASPRLTTLPDWTASLICSQSFVPPVPGNDRTLIINPEKTAYLSFGD